MNSSQAQINQMFVWLVVILVIAVVALVGVRSIGGLINDKCTIDMVRFEDDMKDTIEAGNNFGSRSTKTKSLPCDHYKVCFVDTRNIDNNILPTYDSDDDDIKDYIGLIQDSVRDGTAENIFLFNGKEIIPSGYVEEIRLNKDADAMSNDKILCIGSSSGRISMVVEGLGKNTLIAKKPQIALT